MNLANRGRLALALTPLFRRGATFLFLYGAVAILAVMGLATVTLTPAVAGRNAAQLTPIQVSAEKRQLIGLQFATVEDKELTDSIQTTALVEPDEQQEGYVQTRFAGWIRKVFVNQTYQYVRRGQPLFRSTAPTW
jgi:hypothetical protein